MKWFFYIFEKPKKENVYLCKFMSRQKNFCSRFSDVISSRNHRSGVAKCGLFCRANNSRVKVHYDVAFAMLPT